MRVGRTGGGQDWRFWEVLLWESGARRVVKEERRTGMDRGLPLCDWWDRCGVPASRLSTTLLTWSGFACSALYSRLCRSDTVVSNDSLLEERLYIVLSSRRRWRTLIKREHGVFQCGPWSLHLRRI